MNPLVVAYVVAFAVGVVYIAGLEWLHRRRDRTARARLTPRSRGWLPENGGTSSFDTDAGPAVLIWLPKAAKWHLTLGWEHGHRTYPTLHEAIQAADDAAAAKLRADEKQDADARSLAALHAVPEGWPT